MDTRAIERKNPPAGIKAGTIVKCRRPSATTTKGRNYIVRNWHAYLNGYGEKGKRYWQWDQFIIIKNDFGFTVKMNLEKFEVLNLHPSKGE